LRGRDCLASIRAWSYRDDLTLILNVLLDIRASVQRILDGQGEEEEGS
jgi:hypothetical protein